MRDRVQGAPAGSAGGARRVRGPALAPVRAACRLCGFSVRGFLNGTTCVLQVDGRALRSACRRSACHHAAASCGEEHACAGLRRRCGRRGAPNDVQSLCRLDIAAPASLSNPYAIGRISGIGTVAHGPVRCGGAIHPRAARRGYPHVRSFDAGGGPGLLRPVARLRLLVRTPVRRPAMTLDYGLGGLMTLGCSPISPTPSCGPSGSEEHFHDALRLAPDRAVLRDRPRPGEAAGSLHDPGLHRRLHPPLARAAPGRARPLPLAGIDEAHEQHWLAMRAPCWSSTPPASCCSTRSCGCKRSCRSTPPTRARWRRTSPSTPAASFVTNTNWQNYGGESTLSYLSQMLGLTHQNFLSAATGIALAVALIRGFARASARTVGSFWVDLTRCTLYVLLPLCIVYTLFLVWQGIRRRWLPTPRPPPWKAESRPSPSGPWRARWRSRCSAPMAAASSTPTPPTRSRTRPRCRT